MLKYTLNYGGQFFLDYFRNWPKYHKLNLPNVPAETPPSGATISVCTTCMNRLHDLKRTLPLNMIDNADYEMAEFVLLDYNSTDGLEEWVKAEMGDHIASGRLVYYKSSGHSFFDPNHSRNISFRLATGSIITNVDADNFMNRGFLARLGQCASVSDQRLLLVPQSFLLPGSQRLMLKGRFAMYRRDLYALGGFDEGLNGYGYDDVSLVFRAIMAGFNIVRFEDRFLDGRIHTPISDRVSQFSNNNFQYGQWLNSTTTASKLARRELVANKGVGWGEATVVKNFGETIVLAGAPEVTR